MGPVVGRPGPVNAQRTADLRFGSQPAMALASAERFSDAPAVIDGGIELSFRDVARDLRRVAAGLVRRGVRPGDRVALWAPNSASWIVAALGVQAAGAWLVPLNTRFRGSEAAYVVERADARVLLVVDDFMGTDHVGLLREAAPDLAARTPVVRIPGPGRDDWSGFLDEGSAEDRAEVGRRIAALGPDDVSDVIFTSGTTGAPKGVLLRHGASLRAYEAYNSGFGLAEGDRHLVATPFFHCFGYKAGWMLSLLVGAATVPVAVFDAGRALADVERLRVTHVPGSPAIFTGMLDHPERPGRDLSSLRVAIVAAASFPDRLVSRMRGELGLDTVMTGYGLTENHAIGTFTLPTDPDEIVDATVGRPADGVTVRIVAPDGSEVAAGTEGELLLGGYAHMTGYLDDPEATAETLVDGWLRTGDLAVQDENGYVRITDRLKDLYIMGGFNVAPAEVERSLSAMPAIARVAVVGMPDPHFGEVGAAFVVPRPGAVVTPEEVVAYARAAMANYKVPRLVTIVDELPVNASGKVLKQRLRERLPVHH
ncbi:FadD3 family acyl-CoA ligase [Pseudonocardia ailaonensis]|uniref:FadD3 family acyl-CoA ligase n=1 Tax=Pseudonocardia ailaonensis TaxID=367279 RepID=A0ABN2NFL5_9PSEU